MNKCKQIWCMSKAHELKKHFHCSSNNIHINTILCPLLLLAKPWKIDDIMSVLINYSLILLSSSTVLSVPLYNFPRNISLYNELSMQ